MSQEDSDHEHDVIESLEELAEKEDDDNEDFYGEVGGKHV